MVPLVRLLRSDQWGSSPMARRRPQETTNGRLQKHVAMPEPHQRDLRVRFYELDPYGHVNHSVYVQYFEVGRVEALDGVGMSLDRLQRDVGLSVVVVDIATRFHQPAHLGDLLVVETGISAVSRVRATWLQRIRRGDDVVVASQRLTSCALSTTDRPVRFPAELVEALAVYRVDEGWLDLG